MISLNVLLKDHPHHVLFSCIAGSRAYGTHTEDSDEDIRGIYAVRAASYLALNAPAPQLADERGPLTGNRESAREPGRVSAASDPIGADAASFEL